MLLNRGVKRIFTRLHNVEHVGFGEEVVENIKAEAESIPTVKPDWDNYEAAVGHESAMYKQSPDSPETKDIADSDAGRDKYWREMLHRLKFLVADPDEDTSQAAGLLLRIMETYGKVTENNLFAETIAIRKVLQAFQSAEALAAIALIDGFDKLVAAITLLNEKLHELYDKRRIEKEKIKDLGRLVDYRKVVDGLFITFLDSVNAADLVNERGAKVPAIKTATEKIRLEINSLLATLENILNHRTPKPGGGKKPDPGTPGEGDGGSGEGGGGDEGEGGDEGDGGEGGTENPDIENPPPPPFLPDFE